MVVWVMLPKDATKRDIKVVLKPSEITVSFKGQKLFGGKLWNIIDGDSMTWTIQKGGKLEITFCKANVGMIWQRFLKQDDDNKIVDGEEVMDPAAVDQIQSTYESAATTDASATSSELQPDEMNINGANRLYNAQELEDCDDASEETSRLYLVNGDSGGKPSHFASLSGRRWLFNVPLTNCCIGQASKFCLRYRHAKLQLLIYA